MKDFYKILGVKEEASEEEIRERWIELTKQYHPDRGEESTSGGRIREINEAYQVLKHSSTRVEYDLKRAFNHGDRERKRKVHFKRWGIPASILIILIILGVIYIKNFEPNQINQTNQMNQTSQKDQINQTNQTNQRNEINQINQIGQTNQINKKNQINERDRIGQRNEKDQRNQRNEINQITMAATKGKVKLLQPPQNRTTPLPNDVVANKPTSSINKTDQKNQRNQINEINQTDQRNQTDQTNLNIEVAQFRSPSLLATEDEVKKFFNSYVNYYNRKDATGILSIFSSKAIQNQKDGLEEIRKMHVDFFSEGQEIHYSLQDMKIEIYQNAVAVKGRYEIEQIVKETGEKEAWRGPIQWVLIKEDGKLKILSMDYKYHRPLREGGGVK